MGRTVDVAEVVVMGKIANMGRSKDNDGSYVRFMGGGGQFTCFVPDDVRGGVSVAQGQEVTVSVDIEVRGNFTLLRAYEVHAGLDGGTVKRVAAGA